MTIDWFNRYEVAEWPELHEHLVKYLNKSEWVFRGQGSECWHLETGIERLRTLFNVDWSKLPDYEWKLLREFRRRAHIYHSSPPAKHDHLEWLALLRHHGGPTRLLDFSYSPFIATYFALEAAQDDSALWAINNKWLRSRAEQVVRDGVDEGDEVIKNFSTDRDGESFKEMFWRDPPLRFVRSANPIRLNERLTLQQGVLLCPGDITTRFEDNFSGATLKANVHKIVLKNRCREETLKQLRKMNIDRTALFPGLDGFAQSLNSRFDEIGKMPVAGKRYTF
ncbi:MAG TPA: FRG domain-containing protein [Kiloniellales bacterium]